MSNKKSWTVGTLLAAVDPGADAAQLVAERRVDIVHRVGGFYSMTTSLTKALSVDDDVSDAESVEIFRGLMGPQRIVVADEPWIDWGRGADFS